jgi:hypothetical protein
MRIESGDRSLEAGTAKGKVARVLELRAGALVLYIESRRRPVCRPAGSPRTAAQASPRRQGRTIMAKRLYGRARDGEAFVLLGHT